MFGRYIPVCFLKTIQMVSGGGVEAAARMLLHVIWAAWGLESYFLDNRDFFLIEITNKRDDILQLFSKLGRKQLLCLCELANFTKCFSFRKSVVILAFIN